MWIDAPYSGGTNETSCGQRDGRSRYGIVPRVLDVCPLTSARLRMLEGAGSGALADLLRTGSLVAPAPSLPPRGDVRRQGPPQAGRVLCAEVYFVGRPVDAEGHHFVGLGSVEVIN